MERFLRRAAGSCGPDGPISDRDGSSWMSGRTMMHLVRGNIIGNDAIIQTPFGSRVLTYCDYTASGRQLGIIEDFMRYEVAPSYANTHTETSLTGRQTNHYREESRAIVAALMKADEARHTILFCGTGMTGCVHKLIDCLGIRIPSNLEAKYRLSERIPREERPVVFVGPMEHHSNVVSWRETIADVYEVPEDKDGTMDLAWLRASLDKHRARPTKIVSFSAGSNVSGIAQDVKAVAKVAKRAGALVFVDYAGAGPYCDMKMQLGHGLELDAAFVSPHKFVGGPGSAGVLVVAKRILTNAVPSQPGGGTVAWVSSEDHLYAEPPEAREDGGTPAILQAIRCGVAFQVRKLVTLPLAVQVNGASVFKAIRRWAAHPNILLMGGDRPAYWQESRLPIVSFNLMWPEERHAGHSPTREGGACVFQRGRRMLHPHFVNAVLNDVYGIQGRSGCSCAGPYGIRLWGLSKEQIATLRRLVVTHELDGAKPGWARVNLCWSMDDHEVDFVIRAVEQMADWCWRLLPLYATHWRSGVYQHRAFNPNEDLGWVCVVCAGIRAGATDAEAKAEGTKAQREEHLEAAAALYEKAGELADGLAQSVLAPGGDFVESEAGALHPETGDPEAVRWMRGIYAFPSDALLCLKGLRGDAEEAAALRHTAAKSLVSKPGALEQLLRDSVRTPATMMARADKSLFEQVAGISYRSKKRIPVRSS